MSLTEQLHLLSAAVAFYANKNNKSNAKLAGSQDESWNFAKR